MDATAVPDADGPTLAAVLDRLEAIERRLDRLVPDGLGGAAVPPSAVRIAPARPVTLADAMVLVALSAVAFLPYRSLAEFAGRITWDAQWPKQLGLTLLVGLLFISPLALAWSVAAILLRLRRPRPGTVRAALRQPGILCAAAAALTMLVLGPAQLALMTALNLGVASGDTIIYFLFIFGPKLAGVAVLATRSVLAAVGPSPPTADWVDGLGRAIGWYWIAVGIACPFFS